MSIAQQRGMIKISPARCAYLPEWRDTRRETIASALEGLLNSGSDGLTIDEILEHVNSRTGRIYSRGQISAALQAAEAEYDEASRTWVPGAPTTDSEEPEALDA